MRNWLSNNSKIAKTMEYDEGNSKEISCCNLWPVFVLFFSQKK
jgi:hypothetical protein